MPHDTPPSTDLLLSLPRQVFRPRIAISLLLLCGLAAAQASQWTWSPDRLVPHIERSVMAYDSLRGRAVLFGATNCPTASPQTWEWDGFAWSQRLPTSSPPALSLSAMAFDTARSRVVLFGGSICGNQSGATWEWDGYNWTPRAATVQPTARNSHAMAYDSFRGRVVLFGGRGIVGGVADTWEWDGTTWISRGNGGPRARSGHAMSYDALRQRVVLFGGFAGYDINDTWEWDGTAWANRSPASAPPARSGHAMVWDPVRARVLMYGGTSSFSADTWEWDGTIWSQQRPPTDPSARCHHAMAYDSKRNRTVLFGGEDSPGNSVAMFDTWEWDGTTWMPRIPLPKGRVFHAMEADPARRQVVLFGGTQNPISRATLVDTWTWDGRQWALAASGLPGPPARSDHAMAYDPMRQRVVLFGGAAAPQSTSTPPHEDTWEWDGSSWYQVATAVTPPARLGHAMAWDGVNQRVLLFGGTSTVATSTPPFGDTWEWDGSRWFQMSLSGPSARHDHAMTYDALRGRIVLFGGMSATSTNDTWEWDGSQWLQANPAASPAARWKHGLSYDSARGRTVLTGGMGAGTADTWEWDGQSWLQIASATSPGVTDFAMAHDTNGDLLLFGGSWPLSVVSGISWLYRDRIPPGVTVIGSACAGSSGLPQITTTVPYLGHSTFFFDIVSARGGAPCAFGLAAAGQSLALGGGCSLYVQAPIVPLGATVNPGGFATVELPIPNQAALRGGTVWAQGFVLDPLGSFAGIAFTGGLRLVIGN